MNAELDPTLLAELRELHQSERAPAELERNILERILPSLARVSLGTRLRSWCSQALSAEPRLRWIVAAATVGVLAGGALYLGSRGLPLLASDPEFVRRFLAEARAMASVNHPGVVSIHDYGQDAAGAYLVMEYVESEPLSRVLGRVGRLHAGAAMHVVAQAAQALQAVHDKGIVHRDVKPANLLVRPDGAVAITDFGVALGGGTALTSSGALLGTPSYLSPEQVLGQPATPRSDIYALGIVAYECLTGRRPFDAESPYAVAIKRLHEPPPPMDDDVLH